MIKCFVFVLNFYKKGDKSYKTGVHRLVAKAFIPNPNNYREVNHIDENKDNNNYKNLEWCNREQNISHSIKSGKFIITQVAQYDKNNNWNRCWILMWLCFKKYHK